MRISSGSWKGRRLKSPRKLPIRPPLEKLKQSVFNILAGEIENKNILDLFAGTGSFGLEALSRGGARATFVDSSHKSCRLLKENIALLKVESQSRVICSKVSPAIRMLSAQEEKFNLIFVDPPFSEGECQSVLDALADSTTLADLALVVLHHHSKEQVNPPSLDIKLVKSRKFGDNLVSIFLYSRSVPQ